MTFEELENDLPNGFHDMELHGLNINWVDGSMTMDLNFWTGDLDGPNREEYTPGVLTITGLCFCSIDPPDPSYQFLPDNSPLNVSGDAAEPRTLALLGELSQRLPPGASCYRFFVHEWNSFIHIAAKNVQLAWAKGKAKP